MDYFVSEILSSVKGRSKTVARKIIRDKLKKIDDKIYIILGFKVFECPEPSIEDFFSSYKNQIIIALVIYIILR